jgi:hypothetical protein
MATLVLQSIGSVVGGAVAGPVGSVIGRLAGMLGGAAIDQAMQPHAPPRYAIGPRLKAMDGIASSEGAGLPRVYGRARLGGQMIWATRFLERANASWRYQPGSGKSNGTTTVNVAYSYSANFAIAICEGPIAFIRRIWADGVELDMTRLPIRIYRGDESQTPDPLIVARESAAETPAYRGVAYVVFDDLPLAPYGNRIPQLTFEVVKPVSGLGEKIQGIDLIPGATEAGYLPGLKLNFSWPGVSEAENRHQLTAPTDWIASIDALQALCPNLKSIALVVAWFGDDLRAAHCKIVPGVDSRFKTIGQFNYIYGPFWPPDWSVAGQTRASARLVSMIDGRAAYGGTPSDASVQAAIADLKARGLSVVFYPFVMMDIPPGNTRPNPYTGVNGQPVFPWRGRITCDPAPGTTNSPDGTAQSATQINAFFAGYRNFILHYARLCQSCGGVDAFLVGSEMIGLTRVRSAPGVYPMTTALAGLAQEVKNLLGPATKISYAADWTEYGAHSLPNGELRFPLDPLWASSAVDFIGLDAYWPLSDWRDGDTHADAQISATVHDIDYLKTQLASGEGYDWYYADAHARDTQKRTPIVDGLGKPWVYRQKDIHSWWSNAHIERVNGVELGQATPWVAKSKPIWIIETGCPAVDRGTNSPNVFPDTRSAEGGIPWFSRGSRDDLIQTRFLEATLAYFDPSRPGAEVANPLSPLYGGRMVDPARIHLWCWDARPYPAFPALGSVWSDGDNWSIGHWLNGRLESAPLDHLVMALCKAVEAPGLILEHPKIDGFVDGYVLDRPMSPREAIDPLAALFGFDAVTGGGRLTFVGRRRLPAHTITLDDLVVGKEPALVTFTRAQESDLPHEISLTFSDSENNFQVARVSSRRLEGRSLRQSEAQAAVMTHRANAQVLADIWLQDLWAGRETADFTLRPGLIALEPGDVVRLDAGGDGRLFQIRRITDGVARRISARAIDRRIYEASSPRLTPPVIKPPLIRGPAHIVTLDLALVRDAPRLSYIAAFAEPWPGALAVYKIANGQWSEPVTTLTTRAMIGVTQDVLQAGPTSRFDNGSSVTIKFGAGQLLSSTDAAALAGRSSMAICGADGAWEIFAFVRAELVGASTYRLSRLVRGLGGASHLAARETPAGAVVVLLDDAVKPLATDISEIGAPQEYTVGPADLYFDDPLYVRLTATATNLPLRPYAPTHAQARRTPQGVEISFIRKARIHGDIWDIAETPLDETTPAFEAEISTPTGTRLLASATTHFLYQSAQEIADFGAQQYQLSVSIYQLSDIAGRGFPLRQTLTIQQD